MFFAVDEVRNYFNQSSYKNNQKELKRFQIIQGYYSYLAYVAYVKDKDLKQKMIEKLAEFLNQNNIIKREIKNYKRFNEVYLSSLPLKKKVYYGLSFINLKLLTKI